MRRAVVAILGLLACSVSPASADLGMTMTMSMNAGGMSVNATMETRVKALKMRSDIKMMQQDMSIFFDTAAGQVFTVNHATREITSTDPSALAGDFPVAFGEAVVSMKPNGQTKELLGRTCQGYALEMTVPMSVGQEAITMRMSGTLWIADTGPGVEEYRAVSKAAADSGFSTSFMAQGPQAKGMLEMQKAMADAGIPLAQELQMTLEGAGQAAAVMAQFGNMTMSTTVTALSTGPIADEVFSLPAGYTKK
ncbi:MAG: hypothetical protein R6V57_18825 [Vicinamibacterales bacterium]